MVSKQEQENKLALIPKSEKYIEYMLDVMIKLPRTEKFSIGTEYKQSMYKILNKVMILNKIKNLNKQDENSYKIEILKILNENEVDQYIKHELKVKYYFRYLDDSIILIKTTKEAKEILEKIKIFLKDNLQLELNKKTQIFKNKQGVNFCGYKINEYRLKIRDKGKRKLKKKVKVLKEKIKQSKITSKEAKKYLAGHMGYIQIANTYNLEKKLFYKLK